MSDKKRITVYSGSSSRVPQRFLDVASEVGRLIASEGATLVYGAGRTGLMGASANAALAAGGDVDGIIPTFMVERGWHHAGLSRLVEVESMHVRKELMMRDSIGVIALPGGIGTFEEITEAMTWRQLGLYNGNVVILNADGYYAGLIDQLRRAVECGFMGADHTALLTVATTPAAAVAAALATPHPLTLTPKF